MKNINSNLALFILLISLHSCIIVIPFKTYYNKEPEIFTSYDVIYHWGKNILYSNSLIGTPPQKISLILHSENFESDLYQHMCDVEGSNYNKYKSSSFNIQKVINKNGFQNNCSKIDETIYLYDDLNTTQLKPFKNYILIYSDNEQSVQGDLYEYHENTCINLGFLLTFTVYNENAYNLIEQLKEKYDILETCDFSLEYTTENEGKIVIGVEPHIYEPEKYFENQYRIVKGICQWNNYIKDFAFNFDKIYLSYKNKINETIETEIVSNEICVGIKLDMGVIFGPAEYEKKIKKIFFDELINEKKCFVEFVVDKRDNTKYNVYYCNKASTEKIIENYFPTIYFEMKQFQKTFELNYTDLFKEKNDKIYFLVYFKTNSYFSNYFEIGSIFLKKYFFTFNQETKMIGYYNEDLPGGKKNKNRNNNDNILFFSNYKYLVISIGVLIIIFGAVGFFFGKMVYDRVRKKRINEVEDNYDYIPEENEGNNNKTGGLGINDTE